MYFFQGIGAASVWGPLHPISDSKLLLNLVIDNLQNVLCSSFKVCQKLMVQNTINLRHRLPFLQLIWQLSRPTTVFCWLWNLLFYNFVADGQQSWLRIIKNQLFALAEPSLIHKHQDFFVYSKIKFIIRLNQKTSQFIFFILVQK